VGVSEQSGGEEGVDEVHGGKGKDNIDIRAASVSDWFLEEMTTTPLLLMVLRVMKVKSLEVGAMTKSEPAVMWNLRSGVALEMI